MDLVNKKKRASVSFDQSNVVDDEAKAKLKYQTLLNEYLELQKEFVSRKRKLQAAKQKRETILGEVRFLRRKRKYLLETNAPNMDKAPLFYTPDSDINHTTTSVAAPENVDKVLVSNSIVKNEDAKGKLANKENARFSKKLKNHLIRDKGSSKQKMSWPDHISLKV